MPSWLAFWSRICWALVPAQAGQYAAEVSLTAWDNDGRRVDTVQWHSFLIDSLLRGKVPILELAIGTGYHKMLCVAR